MNSKFKNSTFANYRTTRYIIICKWTIIGCNLTLYIPSIFRTFPDPWWSLYEKQVAEL